MGDIRVAELLTACSRKEFLDTDVPAVSL